MINKDDPEAMEVANLITLEDLKDLN